MNYSPWDHYEQRYPPLKTKQQLQDLNTLFRERSAHYIGFPNSRILSFEEIASFLKFNINNIGDPYHPNDGINTCQLEREVIAFWSRQFHLEAGRAWGYITSGSTEAIMYGIAQGRDRYEDAVLISSEESHYCLQKIAHLLRLPHQIIPSHQDGRLDLEALSSTIRELDGRPCILNLTVGTTFHGAIEAPEQVLEMLERHHCKEFHVHVDAALYGPMLPWINGSPLFDFRLPIHTLSFSGHKFLGSPMPCGVLISHRDRVRPFNGCAQYVGSVDTTLSSSRNGLAALVLWVASQRLGTQGLAELAAESFELATEFTDQMNRAGIVTMRHPHGCILVFPRPEEGLCRRWQLATRGDFAHIVTIPGVTRDMLKSFLDELTESTRTDTGHRCSNKEDSAYQLIQ